MVKINGFKVYGRLSRKMTARSVEQFLQERYHENEDMTEALVRAAWHYGISARSGDPGTGGYVAIYRAQVSPARFLIEEGTAEDILSDVPGTVAVARPVGYSKPSTPRIRIRKHSPVVKEAVMAPRGSRTATRTRRAPKAAPAPEPEEELEEDELEDDEEELEDLEEELEDADEDEDEEEDEEEEEDDEDEAPDYSAYATKAITPTMEDFAEWLNTEVGDISLMGKKDPVRLVALAGTLRMEFQKSDFNKSQRAARQAETTKSKAAAAKTSRRAQAAVEEDEEEDEEEEEQPRTRRTARGKAAAAPKSTKAATPARTAPTATRAARSSKPVPAAKGKAAVAGKTRTRAKGAAAPF